MPKDKRVPSQAVVADRVRQARERAKITQFEVCMRVRERTDGEVKMGPTEISRLESGKGFDIQGSKVRALALALDCSTDFLFGLSAKPK